MTRKTGVDFMPPAGWPHVDMASAHAVLAGSGSEFELTCFERNGVRLRRYKHAPATLREMFEASWRFAERDFLVFEDERVSYAAHNRAVTCLANILTRDYGITKGDRVVIAMRNWPEWVIAFWASVVLGAIAVPLNAWGSGRELAGAIIDSEAKLAFVDNERLVRLREHSQETKVPTIVVRTALPDAACTSWESLLGAPADYATLPGESLPAVKIGPNDPATLLYTSGTTSAAKGVLATQCNIITNVVNRSFCVARAALRRGDLPPASEAPLPTAFLVPVPLFHVTGCHTYLVPTLASGNTMVLMYRWSVARACELIERERVATLGCVPTMMVQMLASPDLNQRDLSSLNAINIGGAPSGESLLRAIRTALPAVRTSNGYGMTESSSLISQISAEDQWQRPASVGYPVPTVDVQVTDPAGTLLPAGVTGEILVRGSNVVPAYFRNPTATRESFHDGWLRTGDLGYLDAENFLFLVDRRKDMIIRGGENVYCVEVEEALSSCPGVMASAVFGLPDAELGELVAAVVQLTPGAALDSAALHSYLKRELAAFKIPARWQLTEEALPVGATGKILKAQLREQFPS